MTTAEQTNLGAVGNFTLVEETAINPFGTTMRAEHRYLKGLMASIHLYDDPIFVRNLRQIRSISPISGHNGIVRLEDFNPELENPYIVSELISGRSLRSQLDQQGAIPFEEGIQIFSQILGAIRFAHARGSVHEDLNPDYIYLTGGGDVKIYGFGLGAVAVKSANEYGAAKVTSGGRDLSKISKYKTKNQKAGGTGDLRDDIFALGIILHEILTGSFPRRQTLPSDIVATIPKGVNKIYARCCTRPERRYTSVKQLQEEIEELKNEAPPSSIMSESRVVLFGEGYQGMVPSQPESEVEVHKTESQIARVKEILPSLRIMKKKVAFLSMAEMCGTRNAIDEKSLGVVENNLEYLRTLELMSYAFDFSSITYVSSSGLSYLVNTSDDIKKRGGEAILYSITPKIRQILDVLGLENFFTTFENEEAAKAHFAKKF